MAVLFGEGGLLARAQPAEPSKTGFVHGFYPVGGNGFSDGGGHEKGLIDQRGGAGQDAHALHRPQHGHDPLGRRIVPRRDAQAVEVRIVKHFPLDIHGFAKGQGQLFHHRFRLGRVPLHDLVPEGVLAGMGHKARHQQRQQQHSQRKQDGPAQNGLTPRIRAAAEISKAHVHSSPASII